MKVLRHMKESEGGNIMSKGIAASRGYAIGSVSIKGNSEICVVEKKVDDINLEYKRLDDALEISMTQLKTIKEKAEKELGSDKAAVFESHMMLLIDPEFIGGIKNDIKDKSINAEMALKNIVDMYLAMFDVMEDEYMKERAGDVRDVYGRIHSNLTGVNCGEVTLSKSNSVVVAHDLTPSDTALLDKSKVSAFVTDIGGRTSHSAIMARTLEIPAVVGMKNITELVKNGDTIIVDGILGEVIINPDKATIKEYEFKKKAFEEEQNNLKRLKEVEIKTKEGKVIEVCGNIGSSKDVDKVLENGGNGVGLFRTEFLYMDRDSLPTEDQQFEAYKTVLEKMGDKPVIIRTLDIGGDKKLSYLPLAHEENPFLGYRAIRLCLDRTDIFKTQLRGLLRASVYGNLKIMFPMIASLDEFLKAKSLLEECMTELKSENIPFKKDIPTGIMVEIPAAAIMADELAKHVDFFSIGTNDLTQYTLAADRMNEKISYIYDWNHPAVLRLIKMTIEAAHKAGKTCGMCGEMAGAEESIPTLLEYGLDEFSMSSSSILSAKSILLKNLEK